MENLNKENFWNEIQEKYPDAMAHFCKWIDDYKIKNNIKELFNEGCIKPNSAAEYLGAVTLEEEEKCLVKAPKFHDLPIEMQVGILAYYDMFELNKDPNPKQSHKDLIRDLTYMFEKHQKTLTNGNNKEVGTAIQSGQEGENKDI